MSDIYENFFIPVEGGPLRGNKGATKGKYRYGFFQLICFCVVHGYVCVCVIWHGTDKGGLDNFIGFVMAESSAL